MIKLFRKIRKKLVSENKIIKYIIYAFGEVILIVIGIFLGLNLDMKYQKNAESEIADNFLFEMMVELNNDIDNLNSRIIYLKDDTQNREQLLNSNDINQLNTISLYKMILGTNLDFKVSTLTYEKYKNLTASKLSNKQSLNTEIFNYYNLDIINFNLFTSWQFETYTKLSDYLYYNQNDIDLTGNSNFTLLVKNRNEKNNRENIIEFIESTIGKNLIASSFYSEKKSLEMFIDFRDKTINLLQLIEIDLRKRKPDLFSS